MANIDLTNSHYLNQVNRIFPVDEQDSWQDRDADYNIMEGLTFGESEDITLEKQGWRSEA